MAISTISFIIERTNSLEVLQASGAFEHLPGQFVTVDQHENRLGLAPLSGGLHRFRYRTLFWPDLQLMLIEILAVAIILEAK
jgi:hypothetical protein